MDAPVAIARLRTEDAGELLTVQRAAYTVEAQAHVDPFLPPLTETIQQVMVTLDVHVVWGLREPSGRLVGGVRVAVDDDVARIGRLVVAPDRQRRGYGDLLLHTAENRCPATVRRFALFTGEHSASNLRFYAARGYVEQRRSPAGAHYDVVYLTKTR